MSMNLRFGTNNSEFPVLQTTTEETYKIMESPSPIEAYIEHYRERVNEWIEVGLENLSIEKEILDDDDFPIQKETPEQVKEYWVVFSRSR